MNNDRTAELKTVAAELVDKTVVNLIERKCLLPSAKAKTITKIHDHRMTADDWIKFVNDALEMESGDAEATNRSNQ